MGRMKQGKIDTCHPTGPADKLEVLLPRELFAGHYKSPQRVVPMNTSLNCEMYINKISKPQDCCSSLSSNVLMSNAT